MGRVTERDLRRVIAFFASARGGTPGDPLPRPTLAALRDLIDADEVEYFELRRTDRTVLAEAQSQDFESAPGSEEAIRAHGWQNPLGWRRWTPADGALRLSERIARRDLTRLAFYREGMLPNRLRDILKIWLWSSPGSVACVQAWRREGDFTAREQALLAVLHKGLTGLREAAIASAYAVLAESGDALLTTREAEVLVLACRGVSDEVIAHRLGLSPATVGKHLEHAYDKLSVHSRAEALWRLASLNPTADGPRQEHVEPDLRQGGRLDR